MKPHECSANLRINPRINYFDEPRKPSEIIIQSKVNSKRHRYDSFRRWLPVGRWFLRVRYMTDSWNLSETFCFYVFFQRQNLDFVTAIFNLSRAKFRAFCHGHSGLVTGKIWRFLSRALWECHGHISQFCHGHFKNCHGKKTQQILGHNLGPGNRPKYPTFISPIRIQGSA